MGRASVMSARGRSVAAPVLMVAIHGGPVRVDKADAGPGETLMYVPQPPILTAHKGGHSDEITGETVLNEVFDLLRHRLPHVAASDPARPHLVALAPLLGDALGRPRAVAVPEARLLG